jgi:uncharacterized membrane protein
MKRFTSIDFTRGLVMVIMALDHVREFIHKTSMTQDPTNLETTTAILFLTRWVTHLCAPAFVFLAGVSAYISIRRKNNLRESRKFLLTRGIWLLVLEFAVINFALWFDIQYRLLLMEVIAAIGLSFIVLSFLLRLPSRVIGIIGVLLIIIQNLVQNITVPSDPVMAFIFSVLFHPGLTQLSQEHSFYTAYPLISWLGIMLAGFSFGELFDLNPEKRRKIFLRSGMAVLSAFIIIRAINIFGDPSGWSLQKNWFFTFLSFINVSKYPPSLLFTFLFTGITLTLLSVSETYKSRLSGMISVYGRVPLFYFIIHLFIIHATMFLVLFIQGFGTEDFVFGAFKNGRPETGGGTGLTLIYIIWIVLVLFLYPVCKWFGEYKAAQPEKRLLRFL